jgi:RHS repeat-associated protein
MVMTDSSSCSPAQRLSRWQYSTGKERDAETGLDYFLARYYSGPQGRFTSPDPTMLSVNTLNPQTWNRYSYVLNNPLRYVDPLGLWAISYEDELDKDGKLKRRKLLVHKSKDDDNAASLAEQLGYKGKDAEKLAAKITKKFGDSDNIQLSKMGGAVGRTFDAAETGLTAQAKYDAKGGGQTPGPIVGNMADCSMTAMSIAAPSSMAGVFGTFGVQAADDLIGQLGLASVSPGNERTGDVIRWGVGDKRHFANMIFTGDDGITEAFSRSGMNGKFQIVPLTNDQFQKFYGQITGRFRPNE